MKFYKVLNEKECHYGMQYKTGLNVDVLPWNPSGSCEPGGLYFTDVKNIFEFCEYGPWIREVTLPEGEEVYKDPDGNKFKAHRIILGKRRRLFTKTMIRKLIKEGADVHVGDDYVLQLASSNGHADVVELLLNNGADVHADDDCALRWAARYGQAKAVRLLLDHGADVHACDDSALRWAARYGQAKAVRLLLDHGADVHAWNDWALQWAAENGHAEVAKILLDHGANVHVWSNCALRVAAQYGHTEVIEILKKAMSI